MFTYNPADGTVWYSMGKNQWLQSVPIAPAAPVNLKKKKKVTQNRTTSNSVTMDISAARFKSQMICSNQNKSHLVIFSGRFIVLVFCSLQQ